MWGIKGLVQIICLIHLCQYMFIMELHGTESEDSHQRSRALTEKGRSYQLDLKLKDRDKTVRKLDTLSNDIHRLIDEDKDHTIIQDTYSRWLSYYEDLLDLNDACIMLSDSDDQQELSKQFEKETRKFSEVKSLCESWVTRNTRRPSSNYAASQQSVASQVSIERVKEAQRQAELKARASSVKLRQELEEEKLRVRFKEEELNLKTELEVSSAREKALDYLERSFIEAEEELRALEKSTDLKSPSTSTPKQIVIDNNNHALNYSRETDVNLIVTRELNKPKAEILKFDGNVLDYKRFTRQFNQRVCSNTDSFEEKLNFLLQFTSGEAHKLVVGYSNLSAEKGFKAAIEEFAYRYGDQNVIARTYVERALNWPVIKADEPQALDEYAIFLRECLFAVGDTNASAIIEYPDNLKLIVKKLPYFMHDKWRNIVYDVRSKNGMIKFETLVSFIRKEALKARDPVYGRLVLSNTNYSLAKSKSNAKGNTGSKSFVTNLSENGSSSKVSDAQQKPCIFCNLHNHALHECNKIREKDIKDRFAFLRSKGLCFGCLKSGHFKNDCRNKDKCKYCNGLHTSILHINRSLNVDTPEFTPKATSSATHMGAGEEVTQALPIVPVRVNVKSSDKYLETYAFLDSGSTASFCSERLVKALNLEGKKAKISLSTMNKESVYTTYKVSGLEISSLDGNSSLDLPVVYTQGKLPVCKKDVISSDDLKNWSYLKDVSLQRIESPVDLLIGVNVPKAMEPWEVIPSQNGGPFAVKTIFGWVINGPLDTSPYNGKVVSNFIKVEPTLQDQIVNQFNYDFCERVIDDVPENSREDKQFLQVVANSVKRIEGHYSIDLPFVNRPTIMPNNRKQAEQRLIMLRKRFEKDVNFHRKYTEFMDNIFEKGYAQKVSRDDVPTIGQVWYLPHHGVYHPKKDKIRVVFDCAAKFQGVSLNDMLLQGPNLTNNLVGTLLRFRQEKIAVTGDIESMFYQVQVTERDRNYQRFLWWDLGDTSKNPTEYKMNVHLFGSTSSPSCANYALRKAAIDVQGKFDQEAIDTVLKNFYVDDCLKSTSTVSRATSLVKDVKAILEEGGFNISKWISNSREVVNSIPVEDRASGIKDLDLDCERLPIERTLGVSWCMQTDTFNFTIDLKDQPFTRRGILSCVSSIYDPLGFLSPLVLRPKTILQELCQAQLSWDDQIPEKYARMWRRWLNDIQDVSNYCVERCYKPQTFGQPRTVQLHHFADASEKGYGTVTYLRLVDTNDRIHCSFVMGKSRVAPLKKVTVPRLELTAATVAVRTDKMLKRELEIMVDSSYFWTDSMSVLRYIRNTSSRFHTFVANRLTVIHEGSGPDQWCYINTKQNPADLASRGMGVIEKDWLNRWIKAPDFLWSDNEQWSCKPEGKLELNDDDPEVKVIPVGLSMLKVNDEPMNRLINYHSSWYGLKRSVAWILKIRSMLQERVRLKYGQSLKGTLPGKLTLSNLQEAESEILRFVQLECFADEIKDLQGSNSKVKKRSSLKSLDPIIQDKLLCVGGRLHNANISCTNKHPVILPKDHHVSTLILRDIHSKLMHSGRNHMLANLRQRYWLIRAPSAIKKVISKCVDCRRQRAHVGQQKMSTLPRDRVIADEPPFTRVGVDYFGPFEVKMKRSRVKRWGVIFTCLASRAVHLELAYSLDTSSYINALRRFIARRGQVKKMISDNGTNFVGAERELKAAINEWNSTAINSAMIQHNVEWTFNPPMGSHFGGVWERLIKSVRSAMNYTLKQQVLDDEGLSTLLCEIEAILNSRPLTRASDQPNDLNILTPNHLLLLKSETNLPPGIFDEDDNYCKRRWRQIQFMSNLFWKRWVREYLPLLQERQKWHFQMRNVKVGDIVVNVDSNAPRNSWPLAVVVETLPDRAGLVRQVKVRTATNVLVRPIDKLVVMLELE